MSIELIERLRADLDAAAEQHMPVMVVTTDYMRGVLDQIAQLQAELAEAREVPGRIVDWIRSGAGPYVEGYGGEIATAIEARDWSKP